MALVLKDRVKETTSTAGTGAITLGGTSTGFQAFSVIGDGNTTYYTISDPTTGAWEVGVGTYTSAGNTLSRDSVFSSSNSGNLVNFAANAKDVFIAYPAEEAVTLDSAQTLSNKTLSGTNLGTPTAGVLTNATGLPLTTGVTGTLPVGNGGTGATSLTGYVKSSGTSAFTAVAAIPGSDVSGNISGNAANVTGTVAIANGGTGATDAATARANLGAGTGNGTVTSVGGTGTVNGITLTGTVTSSGNLTLGGTLSGVSLTSQVSGTLPIANGGTGQTTQQTALNALAGATTSAQFLRGNGTNVVMSAIQASDVPTLNQNTTGSAGSVANALTINNSGTGDASGATYNGSAAKTISYNSVGASPLAGSSSITTVGTITSGTWNGATLTVPYGGTGQTSYTDGQLLIGNTATGSLSKATLTAGSGITITNGNGSISIAASGGTGVSVGTSPPGSPSAGSLWWDSYAGDLKIYYNDGNTSQWVEAATGATGATGPTGPSGAAATLDLGATTVVNPNVNPSVAATGTSAARTFSFSLPRASTTTIGTVTTGAAGSSATVTNTGTNGDVTLNFTIPQGATGSTGSTGPTGPMGPKSTLLGFPATTDTKIVMFYTTSALTISKMVAVLPGGTSTPSVTFNVRYGSDVSATGTAVVTGGTTTTSTTTGTSVTSFNNATISAGSFAWVEVTAVSGTVPALSVTLEF